MPTDALLKCYAIQLDYPRVDPDTGLPQPDVDCQLWGGIIEFTVQENGSYLASVPFEGWLVPWGTACTLDQLVYDGLGGYCGDGSNSTLDVRVTIGGVSPTGPVLGNGTAQFMHPGPMPGMPSSAVYRVILEVENPGSLKKAKLWLYFSVGSMC